MNPPDKHRAATTDAGFTLVPGNSELEEKVINSDRYEDLGRVGRGTWGEVRKLRDRETGRIVAGKVLNPTELAKKQMEERNLDLSAVIRKEADELLPAANIVPRTFEVDNNGTEWLRLPFYDRFMDNLEYIDEDIATRYISDVAKGLGEVHRFLRRSHGDLKWDNIAIDKFGRALINDLGTSTIASYGSDDPRDNMGFPYTRSPENFGQDSHPTRSSDVWGLGALALNLFTNQYPLTEFIVDGSLTGTAQEHKRAIKRKLKDKRIPRKLNSFLKKCLDENPDKRFGDAYQASAKLEKLIDDIHFNKKAMRLAKRFAIPGLVGATIIGLAIAYKTAESGKINIPDGKLLSEVYSGEAIDEEKLYFERETFSELKPRVASGGIVNPNTAPIRRNTDNQYVAYLTKTYLEASRCFGAVGPRVVTENQQKAFSMWMSNVAGARPDPFLGPYQHAALMSIENAFKNIAAESEGEAIDLEDVCVTARCGYSTLNKARNIAGSGEFRNYMDAQDKEGEYVIDRKDKKFILQWLGQVQFY